MSAGFHRPVASRAPVRQLRDRRHRSSLRQASAAPASRESAIGLKEDDRGPRGRPMGRRRACGTASCPAGRDGLVETTASIGGHNSLLLACRAAGVISLVGGCRGTPSPSDVPILVAGPPVASEIGTFAAQWATPGRAPQRMEPSFSRKLVAASLQHRAFRSGDLRKECGASRRSSQPCSQTRRTPRCRIRPMPAAGRHRLAAPAFRQAASSNTFPGEILRELEISGPSLWSGLHFEDHDIHRCILFTAGRRHPMRARPGPSGSRRSRGESRRAWHQAA